MKWENYNFCKTLVWVFCVICGSIAANAQTVDENRDLRLQLDTMFSGVDKSKVPTQLLLDYAIDLVDL